MAHICPAGWVKYKIIDNRDITEIETPVYGQLQKWKRKRESVVYRKRES